MYDNLGDCDTGCKVCSGKVSPDPLNGSCHVCDFSNNYYSEGYKCKALTGYTYYWVYASPNMKNVPLTFTSSTFKKHTFTFFMKILGFNDVLTSKSEIISFGDLKLYYNHVNFALELYKFSTNQLVASYPNFNSLFGYYVFIALSYAYDNVAIPTFPAILNFEVNLVNLAISTGVDITTLGTLTISISNVVFGFFAKMNLWGEYIVGAYGYFNNRCYYNFNESTNACALTSPSYKVPERVYIDDGSSKNISSESTNCINILFLNPIIEAGNIVCIIDYDKIFNPKYMPNDLQYMQKIGYLTTVATNVDKDTSAPAPNTHPTDFINVDEADLPTNSYVADPSLAAGSPRLLTSIYINKKLIKNQLLNAGILIMVVILPIHYAIVRQKVKTIG